MGFIPPVMPMMPVPTTNQVPSQNNADSKGSSALDQAMAATLAAISMPTTPKLGSCYLPG